MSPRLVRAGPAAFYLQIADSPSKETARGLRGLRDALASMAVEGILDLVPGFTNLLVEHRPGLPENALLRMLSAEADAAGDGETPREHVIPVLYGADADREALEAALGLAWPEIVRLHSEALYTVAFIGFTPGFPYLLGLPERLVAPRRATPRPNIGAGSVAMAGDQAGIYPSASPGGWWVLGRTDARLFEPARMPPTLLRPGDELRFRPVETVGPPPAGIRRDGEARAEVRAMESGRLALEVVHAWPRSLSLQGSSRWGMGHLGLAQAGALDAKALEIANELVGNPRHMPALELIANSAELRACTPLTAAITGGGLRPFLDGRELPRWRAFAIPAGATVELVPDGKLTGHTSYLAIAGGFAADAYGGSRSTDARAGVGGHGGRFLAGGDRLAGAGIVSAPPRPYPGRPRYPERVLLRLHPGPQAAREALETLRGSSYRLEGMDRTGARLSGPPVPLERYELPSEGSPWGAVQVPADGQPIVLLADRGRTGGYAKPAVVDVRDLWQLAQAPPGTEIWFI